MYRHEESSHKDCHRSSARLFFTKDTPRHKHPPNASMQASNGSVTSRMVPEERLSPSTGINTLGNVSRPQSPSVHDYAPDSQPISPEHQPNTDMLGIESVVERIIGLTEKLQALEEEHRALLSMDPELLGLDDSTANSRLGEEATLSDQDTTPPSDQSGEDGADSSGGTSSLFESFPSTSSGLPLGSSGRKRIRSDDDEEPDPDDEGNKRPKPPQVADAKGSNSKPIFECPQPGCFATSQFLSKLMYVSPYDNGVSRGSP